MLDPYPAADSLNQLPPLVMPEWSKYCAEDVDISSRRSVIIRDPEIKHFSDSITSVVIDYFFHEGKYWRASIPLEAVDQVYGQTFNFSTARTRKTRSGTEIVCDQHGLPKRKLPILNHVQCRFVLSDNNPAKLYPLGSQAEGTPAHKINDLVYSLEAVGPRGVKFNLKDCLFGNLISAHRLLSTQEMVFERLVMEDQVLTESPPLPISSEEKQRLLLGGILRSHRAGMMEPYYLFRILGTNNCTSSAFQILDEVMTYRGLRRFGAWLYRLPLNPRLYLRLRGLESDTRVRKVVRDEFVDFICDAKTHDRKERLISSR